MLRVLIGALLASAILSAAGRHINGTECVVTVCTASINIPYDDAGVQDNRNGIVWGTAGFVTTPIQFDHVPPGYVVHITHVRGDLVAMMHGKVPEGTNAGILWSLQTTSSKSSDTVEYGSSGCFEYVQGFVNQNNLRAPFNDDTSSEGWLDSDNIVWSKEALWLNDTGLAIHAEVTLVIEYQYVNTSLQYVSSNAK